jgi:hypothetical protein
LTPAGFAKYHISPIFSPDHGGSFVIFRHLIDFCWFCFKWGLVLGAVAVAAAVPYLYRRVDEEIRRRVEDRIAQHYAGLKVRIGSAEAVGGEGIKVRNLVVVEPGAEGPRPELIQVEEVLLGCQADAQELLRGEPQFTHIVVRRPLIRVTRRRDGTWSVSKLLPVPKFNDRPIETRIENGTIEIFDPLKNPSSTLTLRDVNLVLSPLEASAQQPGLTPDTRRVQGTLTGDHLRRIEFEGLADLQQNVWAVRGTVEGLNLSPELQAALPEPLAAKLAGGNDLRGEAELSFQVSRQPAAAPEYQYRVTGRLDRGRIDDPRLPHPLTDLRGKFQLDNAGAVIEEAVGRSNQATVRILSYRQEGFGPQARKEVKAEIRQLELDRRLLAVLPESLQDHWHKYRPSGTVDADVKLAYDGRAWQPDLVVHCLNVSFTHYKFPYRLEDGKGTLTLKDDVLGLNLTAYSGPQEVRLDGEVLHPASGAVFWLEAKADDIPLDEKLLSAIPEGSREVVRSLNPRGAISISARWRRDEPDGELHKHLLIHANRCSVQFDHFRYPVRNILGTLEMFDGSWYFRKLEGSNDTGRVTCEGQLTPTLQGNELALHLEGTDIQLDEELRDALRPGQQQVWNVLRPRGVIDLTADVGYVSEKKQLSVTLRAVPHSEVTSIEPVHFPYRMEKLRGVLHYRDGHVTLERFKAEHGPVRLSTGGSCDFLPEGQWHLCLESLAVDRLRLDRDRDLVQALPERLRKALTDLKLTGPLNLRGEFDLASGLLPGDPVQSWWNVQMTFHQASIDCGVRLYNLSGDLALRGRFDGRNHHSQGEIALDSLHYKDFQLTGMSGPIWIDDAQVLLGSWVARRVNEQPRADPPRPPEQPRPLTGQIFGGTVYGDVWVALGPEPRYGLQGTLVQADLNRCAREVTSGRQNLRGTILATVELRGSGRSTNALGGRGTIRLRDANVYELPLMIALLKILSIRAPDPNAFSKSDIDFHIAGEHIYFDRIDFNGDAISLLGKGELDFQQNIKLSFHAVVGRGDLHVPIVKEVFTGASRQIMLIHVDGTLQNPETRKEAFPGVNQALQQLGDLQKNPGSPGAVPQARQ